MPSAAAQPKKKEQILHWIEPIRPIRRAAAFSDPAWIFELKYDGFRGLLYKDNGRSRFMSRNNNELTRFRDLAGYITAKLKAEDAILDGEIVVLDETGRPQFDELFQRRGTPCFVAFDLLWQNGDDLRSLPLLERKARLKKLTRSIRGLGYVESIPQDGAALFETVKAHDLEGIVAKRKEDRYSADTRWYKIKNSTYSQAESRHDLFEKLSER